MFLGLCVCVYVNVYITSNKATRAKAASAPAKRLKSLVIVLSHCLPLVDLPQYLQDTHKTLRRMYTVYVCSCACVCVCVYETLAPSKIFTTIYTLNWSCVSGLT